MVPGTYKDERSERNSPVDQKIISLNEIESQDIFPIILSFNEIEVGLR